MLLNKNIMVNENKKRWVKSIKYFFYSIRYLINKNKLTFIYFLKHKKLKKILNLFKTTGYKTYCFSTEILKKQQQCNLFSSALFNSYLRRKVTSKRYFKNQIFILFTLDNLLISKFLIFNKLVTKTSIIIMPVFVMQLNNRSICNILLQLQQVSNSTSIIFFFYYPYCVNINLSILKLTKLYKFINFIFIYIVFILKKLIIIERSKIKNYKFNNIKKLRIKIIRKRKGQINFLNTVAAGIIFIMVTSVIHTKILQKNTFNKFTGYSKKNKRIKNFKKFKNWKKFKGRKKKSRKSFLITHNIKKYRRRRKYFPHHKALFLLKKYRLNRDFSHKKYIHVYKIIYKNRIIMRRQLQHVFIYSLDIRKTNIKKTFSSIFLITYLKKKINNATIYLSTILVRVLFIPTVFDSIKLIRSGYVTVNGIVIVEPYYILPRSNAYVTILGIAKRILYLYKSYRYIAFGLIVKTVKWFCLKRYFKKKKYFIRKRFRGYPTIASYYNTPRQKTFRIKNKRRLKRVIDRITFNKRRYRLLLKKKKIKYYRIRKNYYKNNNITINNKSFITDHIPYRIRSNYSSKRRI